MQLHNIPPASRSKPKWILQGTQHGEKHKIYKTHVCLSSAYAIFYARPIAHTEESPKI
ncbi:protein of unknown function [Acidithiobacillus ferrivorans]|uniref:Uncharacterized protein n=1 Tax=Acidithiobacillus ferrivorans TaxID=160808 RepID=A0ABY1MKA5_9PROT|nr:protein of unknown function [Acidithiobacillus ferrivorans]